MKKIYTLTKFILLFVLVGGLLRHCHGEEARMRRIMKPAMHIHYSKDMSPVHVYVEEDGRRTDFVVPRAYFHEPSYKITPGKKINAIKINTSLQENLRPWTVSASFNGENFSDKLKISIEPRGKGYRSHQESMTSDIEIFFPNYWGIYRDLFDRYDSDIRKGDNKPHSFLLVPINQPSMPIYLSCDNYGNPNHRCTVRSDYSGKLRYTLMMPFKHIEQVHTINRQVRDLINTLIIE